MVTVVAVVRRVSFKGIWNGCIKLKHFINYKTIDRKKWAQYSSRFKNFLKCLPLNQLKRFNKRYDEIITESTTRPWNTNLKTRVHVTSLQSQVRNPSLLNKTKDNNCQAIWIWKVKVRSVCLVDCQLLGQTSTLNLISSFTYAY